MDSRPLKEEFMQSPLTTSSQPARRSRRPVPAARWRVAVALFGVLTTLSLAQAVIPIPGNDPGCPFGANCFPGPGATPLFDSMGRAADESGADMHRRMNEG